MNEENIIATGEACCYECYHNHCGIGKSHCNCKCHHKNIENINQKKHMKKEKLSRCGMCGEFLQDPRLYTEEEQKNALLTYCNDCGNKELENQQRTITKRYGDRRW